jgi:hypothetical protein
MAAICAFTDSRKPGGVEERRTDRAAQIGEIRDPAINSGTLAHGSYGPGRSRRMAESQDGGVSTEAITALIAAILALANALDKKGALSFEQFRDALLSMYREMPQEDARGDAGQIFDGMLSQLTRAIRNRETPA